MDINGWARGARSAGPLPELFIGGLLILPSVFPLPGSSVVQEMAPRGSGTTSGRHGNTFRLTSARGFPSKCDAFFHGTGLQFGCESETHTQLVGSFSKLGRRRQREEPRKNCFCIFNVFLTLPILNLVQISSFSAKVLLLSSSLLQKSDCGNFSK